MCLLQDIRDAKVERARAAVELEKQKTITKEVNDEFIRLLQGDADCAIDMDQLLAGKIKHLPYLGSNA